MQGERFQRAAPPAAAAAPALYRDKEAAASPAYHFCQYHCHCTFLPALHSGPRLRGTVQCSCLAGSGLVSLPLSYSLPSVVCRRAPALQNTPACSTQQQPANIALFFCLRSSCTGDERRMIDWQDAKWQKVKTLVGSHCLICCYTPCSLAARAPVLAAGSF